MASAGNVTNPNDVPEGGRRRGGSQRNLQNPGTDGRVANGTSSGRRGGRSKGKEGQQKPSQRATKQPKVHDDSTTRETDTMLKQTISSNDSQRQVEDEDDVEAEVCFICASDIVHQSVSPCNHRTCHICSLRMRALYKSRLCPHCRTEANTVIFTDDPEKRFEDFVASDFTFADENLGIIYERKDIEDDTILLLRYNCPDETCDVACFSWPDLHRHVKSVHQKQMCDLCTRNKKVFTHEHALYSKEELRRHEKFGDPKDDQTGFKGHPDCGFCRQRFYGDDELYVHCREKHEKCHICERSNPQRQHQYYLDYDALEQHFRKEHFLCPEQDCLDKKFVVFSTEMDIKAHQLESHPNGLTKDARRDARRVDMTAFDFRQPVDERSERRRGGRGGARGGGRGRDPNAEPLPPSSAQPMRRDEIAYQRQMAIQSAQSVTTRTFGGQLTSGDAYAARPGNRETAPETVNVPRSASAPTDTPAIQNLSVEESRTPVALTPRDQARQIQHNSVIQRASQMLGNDSAKIKVFRDRVSSYRTGALTASQMVDASLTLFDVPAVELGKLIKELAEIYENEQRRSGLLKAWNDWRAINEDYPSLPGPSGSQTSLNAANTGRRILKLKSSTVQSQRAPSTQSRTWGTIATTGVGSGTNRSGATMSSVRANTSQVGPKSWAASSSTGGLVPRARSGVDRQAPPSADAFPSLPTAPKPNTNMAGLYRGTVGWMDHNPPVTSPWSGAGIGNAGSTDALSPNEVGSDDMDEASAPGGKKKGRKGKQTTLYHFG